MKLKTEAEKEKSKLDPWKLKHFEPIWGERGQSHANRQSLKTTPVNSKNTTVDPAAATTTQANKSLSPNSLAQRRTRTVGAVTRSSAAVQNIESPTKVRCKNALLLIQAKLFRYLVNLSQSGTLVPLLSFVKSYIVSCNKTIGGAECIRTKKPF